MVVVFAQQLKLGRNDSKIAAVSVEFKVQELL